jgi:prevent-host-death family protein
MEKEYRVSRDPNPHVRRRSEFIVNAGLVTRTGWMWFDADLAKSNIYPRALPVPSITAIMAVMKSITALEAKNRFGEVMEAAQRQPVSITRNGRPSVVVISAESYARRQRIARERMRQAMQRAGEYAAAHGMNEGSLDKLLADES